MDIVLSAAQQGAKKLYTTCKDYKKANAEAKDLTERLYMLDKMLDQVPIDQDLVREPLERIVQTVNDSYTTVIPRLRTNDGVWKRIRDLSSSASDRQAFTDIAWKIRGAMSDLHTALSLQSNQEVRQINLELRKLQERLETPRFDSSVLGERTLKQILAKVAIEYSKEPVEDRSPSQEKPSSATCTRTCGDSTSSDRSSNTLPKTIVKYSWGDLTWEDGVGPTRQNHRSCLIRKGGFGSVYKAILQGVGDVALKQLDIDPTDFRGRRFREFKRECILLERVSTHPNVVSFYGMIDESDSVGLVTDLAKGGSLFAAMNEEHNDYWPRLPTVLKLKGLSGVIAAVNYMHSTGVIHADLKPRNVLLATEMSGASTPPVFWVSDFGLARTTHTVKTSNGSVISSSDGGSCGGTVGYMAPETIAKSHVNQATDIFSLSITIWAALTCEEPFQGVSDWQVYLHQARNLELRPDLALLPNDVPEDVVDLLNRGWDMNPETRPSIEQFLEQWDAIVAAYTVDQIQEAANQGGFASTSVAQVDTLDNTKKYCKHLLPILSIFYGERSLEVADAFHNIGKILLQFDDAEDGKTYYEQALAIKKDHYGSRHVEIGMVLSDFGMELFALDKDQALKYWNQALDILENVDDKSVRELSQSWSSISLQLRQRLQLCKKNNDTSTAAEYVQKSDERALHELRQLLDTDDIGQYSVKLLGQLIRCIEVYKSQRQIVSSFDFDPEVLNPWKRIVALSQELANRYMSVIASRMKAYVHNSVRQFHNRPLEGLLWTPYKPTNNHVLTVVPRDFLSALNHQLAFVRETASLELQGKALCHFVQQVERYAIQVAEHVYSIWRTKKVVDENLRDVSVGVTNDMGMLLGQLEQVKRELENIVVKGGFDESFADRVVNNGGGDIVETKRNIPKLIADIKGYGNSLLDIQASLVKSDLSVPIEGIAKEIPNCDDNLVYTWIQSMGAVRATARDYLHEYSLLLEPHFFEILAGMVIEEIQVAFLSCVLGVYLKTTRGQSANAMVDDY